MHLLPIEIETLTRAWMKPMIGLMLVTLLMVPISASARVCTCKSDNGCGVFNAEKIANIAELGPALPPRLLRLAMEDAIECSVSQGDKIEIGAVALTPGAPPTNRFYAATVPGNDDCTGIVVMGALRCGR